MKSLSAEFEQDFLEAITDFGETITHEGTAISALVSIVKQSKDFELMGTFLADGISVTATKGDFDTAPAIGDIIIYKTKSYRINEVGEDGESYSISANNANKA
jgi:hypothetical protein